MTRKLLIKILNIGLSLFFRKISVQGQLNPLGPTILAINHPNGLMDPLLILCNLPKKISFLAKSTLFPMPVIGWVTRGLDSIPVYRRQDEQDILEKNLSTFKVAAEKLSRGNFLALFPEGVSHSDPGLKPLKSGIARIAIGSNLSPLWIQPVALTYSAKKTFRSDVTVFLGQPILVAEKDGAVPERQMIRNLTDRVAQSLGEHLAASTVEFQKPNAVSPSPRWVKVLLWALSPVWLFFYYIHYPPYRFIGFLSEKLSKTEDDLISTFKLIGAMLIFPLYWLAISICVGYVWTLVVLALGARFSVFAHEALYPE